MRKIFTLVFFACIQLTGFSQKKAENALKLIDEKYPQEKIHLFFNKEKYVAGENIWFKAYLFSGYVQSNISTNMYVELYNDKKELLDKIQVPLLNAVGEGSLKMNKLSPEGVYYVRAYTKWMLNFEERFQYINELLVYNGNSEKILTPKNAKWTPTAYAESGTLLSDIENTVVVRLASTGALPNQWRGFVTESNDTSKKIVSFQSFKPQLASFTFTPAKEKTYYYHCFDEAGNNTTTLLRPVARGVVLKARQQEKRLLIDVISRNKEGNAANHKILAQMQGQLVYSATIRDNKPEISTSIPIDKLMDGILHVTLFDENESAIAERLVFIDVEKKQDLVNIAAENTDTKRRALNEWSLPVDSSNRFNYAVSVFDPSIAEPRKRSILSDLWLNDFGPSIDFPASYFKDNKPASVQELDALLITEKWQRFQWNTVMANNFPAIKHTPEKFLSYTGYALKKGIPMVNEDINLIFKYSDSSSQIAQVKTDKNGKFFMVNTLFFDTVNIYYQPNQAKVNPKDISIRFESQNAFQPYSSALPLSAFTLTDRTSGFKNELVVREDQIQTNVTKVDKKYKQLEDIKLEAVRKSATEKLVQDLTTGLYSANESNTFDFVNQNQMADTYYDIYDWLVGRVPGLEFAGGSGERIPVIRGIPATVLIDEVIVDSPSHLSAMINVQDIALVQVIKGYSVALMGGGGGGGAILIYRKKAGTDLKTRTSLTTGKLTGYRKPATIIHMNHEGSEVNVVEKDIRSQLYWNSNFADNAVRFYNNDAASSYLLTVTGFNADGRPVFIEKLIN